MKIYFVRHGETDWNKERKLQGQIDIPLNEFGRKLAEDTAPFLKDIDFDMAFTSPLSRAKETAQIILGERNIPLVEDERIREMGFGSYEGMFCKGDKFNIPDQNFHYFFDAPEKYSPSGDGESFEDVSIRLKEFLNDILCDENLNDKTILISTHGASLCGILMLLKNAALKDFWGNGVHKNCAVTFVEVNNKVPEIIWENRTFYTAEVADW